MKNFYTLHLLGLTLLVITACGFKPMYGSASDSTHISALTSQASIEIANIPNRNGQIIRNFLVDRLQPQGASINPVYKLEIIDLEETIRDLDVTIRSDTTREQMKMTAKMLLKDSSTGNIILEKNIIERGSYNILENEYTSRVSRQNLREDLLRKIALQTERYLAIHFSE